MKNYIILLAILSSLVSISCKKNYSCECSNVPYVGTQITDLGKQSKKVAEDACVAIYKSHPSNQAISCEIK